MKPSTPFILKQEGKIDPFLPLFFLIFGMLIYIKNSKEGARYKEFEAISRSVDLRVYEALDWRF
jgi:hypothetical protein